MHNRSTFRLNFVIPWGCTTSILSTDPHIRRKLFPVSFEQYLEESEAVVRSFFAWLKILLVRISQCGPSHQTPPVVCCEDCRLKPNCACIDPPLKALRNDNNRLLSIRGVDYFLAPRVVMRVWKRQNRDRDQKNRHGRSRLCHVLLFPMILLYMQQRRKVRGVNTVP